MGIPGDLMMKNWYKTPWKIFVAELVVYPHEIKEYFSLLSFLKDELMR